MDTSSENLAIAIGKAMGGGDGTSYDGISYCQSGNHVERYAISVVPRGFIWSAQKLPDGSTRTFDRARLTMQTDGADDFSLSIDRIPFSFPEAVKLCFPLSLPIWGPAHGPLPPGRFRSTWLIHDAPAARPHGPYGFWVLHL